MSTRRFLVLALLLFTLLTAVMTYPQVLQMSTGVHDDGDPLLMAWTLGWIAHQLPHAPAHLFDANMFYPERGTLAYSETMLVPGLVVAPLYWAGVSIIVIYNLVFLSGFALSGVGVALLVRRLTGHAGAAILAGLVFAFAPFRIDHYPHAQLQQTQFIPLALWAFHRLLDTGRIRDGVLLGACVAGQLMSCMYFGIFLLPYMAVVGGTLLIADRRMPKARLVALAVAAAVAFVLMIPVGKAYLNARRVVGERSRQEVVVGSATLRNYLAPPDVNALYGRVFARFTDPERQLFPGFIAVVLAIIGLWPPFSRTRVAYALGLLLAFDVSLGFNGIVYGALYDYVFPFRALRIPARMGLIVSFSLAVLAGYGVARIATWIRSPRSRAVALTIIGLLMLAEYASKPLELYQAPTHPPEAYADIVRERGDGGTAVLFEFPTSAATDPAYLYYSTFHWQSLVNGYSGFFPPSYIRLARAMDDFPDERSMNAIKSHGTQYLVVHGEYLYGQRYETLIPQLDRRADLTLVSRHPWQIVNKHSEISVYRISYAGAP